MKVPQNWPQTGISVELLGKENFSSCCLKAGLKEFLFHATNKGFLLYDMMCKRNPEVDRLKIFELA
jgi:hypothetical protein